MDVVFRPVDRMKEDVLRFSHFMFEVMVKALLD